MIKEKGYVAYHREHGYLKDESLMVNSTDRATIFKTPHLAVNAAIKVWGVELAAKDVTIFAVGWPQ